MPQTKSESRPARRAALSRVAVGLAQGVALYGLHRAEDAEAWPATVPLLFGPLLLVVALVPVMVLAGLGEMRRRTLAVWTAAATAVLAGLALHDVHRAAETAGGEPLSPALLLVSAAALFIAHHLVAGADADRQVVARYPTYFDITWKHGVQLALSLGFTLAFWLLLWLGAALFKVIGLEFLETLIRKDWFWMPATTTAFAVGVLLTDVKVSLIRGARALALTLLSWLLPVMTLIGVGFMAALPFTGLTPLWQVGSATAMLLASMAALIVLINAAYQDGPEDAGPPRLLRLAARVAALLLAPLGALAVYGLALRVGQYGWTPDRVIAAACVLVGLCFAGGYGFAAVQTRSWLRPLELTNVVTAFLSVALVLALFSPVADPARIAVADQVARLERGKVTPDRFDYAFLRFDGARYGREALEALSRKRQGRHAAVIANQAKAALALDNRWDERGVIDPGPLNRRITVRPEGRRLPTSFVEQDWTRQDGPCLGGAAQCDAIFADLDGDAVEEILISSSHDLSAYQRQEDGVWRKVGRLAFCGDIAETLRQGRFRPVEPLWRDLEVGGRRLRMETDCSDVAAGPGAGGEGTAPATPVAAP